MENAAQADDHDDLDGYKNEVIAGRQLRHDKGRQRSGNGGCVYDPSAPSSVFSLTAAAIVMRYQILTIVLEFSLSVYFLEYIYRHADGASPNPLYLPFQKPQDHESLERLPGKE